MNRTILLPIVFAAMSAPCAPAFEVEAPASLEGASIKFFGMHLRPPELSVVKYRPQGEKAEIILSYFKTLMPRIHTSATLSGASNKESVDEENARPAVITFSGRKGNTYYGTVEGAWSTFYDYRGQEEESSEEFKKFSKQEIEIVFPERPLIGKVEAPESIEGAFVVITTDRRQLKFHLKLGNSLYRYAPNETRAIVEMEPPGDPGDPQLCFVMSREENLEDSMRADGDLPLIVFNQVTGTTYQGYFEGYLYGYKIKPETKESLESEMVLISREKLVSITITLPSKTITDFSSSYP